MFKSTRIRQYIFVVGAFLFSLGFISAKAHAGDPSDVTLKIMNHMFDPPELVIPADHKVKLTVINMDSSPAEFESEELGREKVVPANGKIHFFIGPLDPGSYDFVDDFHRSTTTGRITVK
jgi:hypothetical protein